MLPQNTLRGTVLEENRPQGKKMNKALVIFSGGQDSTTSLYWAKQGFDKIWALTFDYGQRHANEIEAAKKIAKLAGVNHEIVLVDHLRHLDTALTKHNIAIKTETNSLPNTFVPGRNILFITLAAIHAYKNEIYNLVLGVCQTDYSGYPDCREEFIKSMEQSLSKGLERPIKIHTPLMHLSKADSVRLAQEVGAMEALALSRTCYEGYPACGQCPACQLRLKGFSEAGLEDPIEYNLSYDKS